MKRGDCQCVKQAKIKNFKMPLNTSPSNSGLINQQLPRQAQDQSQLSLLREEQFNKTRNMDIKKMPSLEKMKFGRRDDPWNCSKRFSVPG